MLCGSLDGRVVWGRLDTYICMAESLHCSPKTITTLLVGYTPVQKKKNKKQTPSRGEKSKGSGKLSKKKKLLKSIRSREEC